MNSLNQEQALVPDRAKIIHNNFGSAPCLWFEKDSKVVVSMPGIPFEMKGLMQDGVLDALKERFPTSPIFYKTIMVYGIGESVLAEMLSEWEGNLPQGMKLAYLPSPGIVRLRLSISGQNKEKLRDAVEEQVRSLSQIIPKNIFGFDDQPMELAVANLLLKKKLTLGTAESCTGGYIAHLVTSHPGSSAYFKGGVVAYSNQVKTDLLKVNANDMERHGAVSQQVVEQMANGAREALHVDYAIATSGIAGPAGGTEEKPVGTVWVAVADRNRVWSKKLSLYKVRDRNIHVAALSALNMLRQVLGE